MHDYWTLMKKLIWLRILQAAKYIIEIVTGNAPLTLTNAISSKIKSLKQFGKLVPIPATVNTAITQYGKCVQNGTPTPSDPVGILCNNGAIKYSANMANVNEQTARVGYYINAQGAVLADQYNWFYQEYISVKPNTQYTLSMSQAVYYVTISEYSTPEDSGFIIRKTGNAGNNTRLTITTGANTNFIRFGSNLNRTEVTLEKVLAINWMLNIGGTAMDYQPYVKGGIYADGTPEVLTVGGQNLVDLTAVTDGYYYDTSGVYSVADNARLTDYIPVRAGQKYTVYVQAVQSGSSVNVRCNLFDAGKVWKSQSVFVVVAGNSAVSTITPSENGFLRVSANYTGTGAKVDWSTLQIVRGEYTLATMPPYEPYVAPQTVTNIPMLLGLDENYRNAWEAIAGIKTGKIGIKVFDGTEDWTAYTSSTLVIQNATSAWGAVAGVGGYCTHLTVLKAGETTFAGSCRFATALNVYEYKTAFGVADVAGFKVKLAEQYAAGTPVIMLYPLATETTEQTTAYPQLANGKYVDADVDAEVSDISVVFTRGQSSTPTPYTPISYMCNNGELKVDSNGDIYAYGTPEELKVSASGAADQIASVVNLLAINNNYRDAQDIIGGLLTHKVGIKVFDGTETFTVSPSGAMITTIPDVAVGAQNTPMNTHFALEISATSIAAGKQRFGSNGALIYSTNYYMKHPTITTVADFKAWLAAEKGAGTPVIMFYPLATEVEESVTPQALTTAEGTNTVSVVSNVDPVELEIEYKAKN